LLLDDPGSYVGSAKRLSVRSCSLLPTGLSQSPRDHRARHHDRPLRRDPHDRRARNPARRAVLARRAPWPTDQRQAAPDHERHRRL